MCRQASAAKAIRCPSASLPIALPWGDPHGSPSATLSVKKTCYLTLMKCMEMMRLGRLIALVEGV